MHELQFDIFNIIKNSIISIATVTLSVIVAPTAQSQSLDGQIRVEYKTAKTPLYQAVSETLQQTQTFEAEAEIVSQIFVLPRDITVSFQECGTDAASYDASKSLIIMCYELLESFRETFASSSETITAEETHSWAINVGKFVFLHELGHALIQD